MARIGDIRQLTLGQINQRVTTGADFSRVPEWAKESIPTSGAPDIKWTKQNPDIEGVDVNVSGAERETLINFSNSTDLIDMAYKTANLDTYTTKGEIAITEDGTQDGKMTLKLLPTGPWTPTVV